MVPAPEPRPKGRSGDYGRHTAWIELFNSGFAPLEISKIYITNDKAKPTMYPVPLGDVNTRIPKRQCNQKFRYHKLELSVRGG